MTIFGDIFRFSYSYLKVFFIIMKIIKIIEI